MLQLCCNSLNNLTWDTLSAMKPNLECNLKSWVWNEQGVCVWHCPACWNLLENDALAWIHTPHAHTHRPHTYLSLCLICWGSERSWAGLNQTAERCLDFRPCALTESRFQILIWLNTLHSNKAEYILRIMCPINSPGSFGFFSVRSCDWLRSTFDDFRCLWPLGFMSLISPLSSVAANGSLSLPTWTNEIWWCCTPANESCCSASRLRSSSLFLWIHFTRTSGQCAQINSY